MATSPAEAGIVRPIIVVEMGAVPPVQSSGTVVTVNSQAVAVRFPDGITFSPGKALLLITGVIGSRHVARGTWAGTRDGVSVFKLASAFRPFDARKDGRVPLQIRGEVRSVLGGSRQPCTILDVSAGGMAVTVASRPGGKSLQVVLTANGYSATLPCETVGASETDDETLLHLRFEELTASQRAFVRQLVASARTAIDGAEERLAS
jgi:hypothetical protein